MKKPLLAALSALTAPARAERPGSDTAERVNTGVVFTRSCTLPGIGRYAGVG